MYIYVWGIDVSLSTIVLLGFRTGPTLWYLFVFNFIRIIHTVYSSILYFFALLDSLMLYFYLHALMYSLYYCYVQKLFC